MAKKDMRYEQESDSIQDSMIVLPSSTKIELSNNSDDLVRKLMVMKSIKINQNLQKLMKERGVTLKALSKATAIPVSTLGSYTAGKKSSYSPEHLGRLCEFFSVSADYLLFGEQSGADSLNSLLTEQVFDGFLKVKIERVIPTNKKDKKA